MVLSYEGDGIVYTFKPGTPMDEIEFLKPVAAQPRPGLTAVLPTNDFRLQSDQETGAMPRRTYQYISPDGTTFISSGEDFATGARSWGVKSADLLRRLWACENVGRTTLLLHQRMGHDDLARHG